MTARAAASLSRSAMLVQRRAQTLFMMLGLFGVSGTAMALSLLLLNHLGRRLIAATA